MFNIRRSTTPLTLAVLAGLSIAPVAMGDITGTSTLSNVPSYKFAGNAGNAYRTVNFPAGGLAYKLLISGTLHRNTAGTYPREACIRIRRLTHVAPNISLMTDEFIAQPFTTTQFDANGNATVTDALVLPVPQNLNFNGHFDYCSMNEPGHYELEFFEQYDDNATDTGSTPDATWTNLSIKFDDTPPSLDTPAPLSGTVGTTTRYGVRSNDTLDHAGAFTGSFIDPLQKPSSGTRVKHVRVTGYVTLNATSITGELAGPNEASQARLRLQRYESVLLSPNDLSPYVSTDDLTITLPLETSSTGFVSMDIPIAANDPWGKLTRDVPTSPNESYGGIRYWATAYEGVDHSYWTTDNIWNGLKIELFSEAQPPSAYDFGTLHAHPNGGDTVSTATATIPVGAPTWFKFTLPGNVNDAANTYLDIDTEGTTPAFDTIIGLYSANSFFAAQRLAFDDDDGSDNLSQLSFGDTGPRAAFGNSQPRNGRDGGLLAGTYLVAVVPYVSGTGTAALGTTDFAVTNPDTVTHPVTLNLRYNLPLGCGPADVASQGGVPGADGVLDNNDFIVFIDSFFNQYPSADRGVQGGIPGTDGVFDNNDFIVFIDQFFAGC